MSGSYINSNTRSDTFNQQAAHDTGLYDPNVHDNQIVALYETEEQARLAQDKLIAAGVESHNVKVMDRGADTMAGGVDYESGNQGIWGAIKSLFMPDEDAHAYSHAIGRGHAMVVVTPTRDTNRHQVIEVLESTDPIDFDAKLEEWRQAGYEGLEASSSPTTGMGQTGDATIDRAQTTPANYAVNQTTVTDNIPADARHTSEMPAGVLGTSAGSAAGAAPKPAPTSGQAGESTGDRGGHASGGATTTGTTTTGTTTAGTTAASTTAASTAAGTGTDDTIQVVREQLRVGKREVPQGAVRVRSYVVERPVEQQVRLHEENVQIERRPVDRPASEADASVFQERTIEAQTRSEVPVVNKEARVVEEIGLHKETNERVETVRDTVRETKVDVEDTSGSGTMGTGGNTTTATTGATSSGTNAPRK